MRGRAAVVGLLVLVLAAGAGAGCTGGPIVPTSQPGPNSSLPAIREGGSVVVARTEEASGFMPYTAAGSSRAARELWSATLPSLVSLAQGAPVEQGREVRVTLRPDAVWSDGQSITVTDVIFTWRLVASESFPAWSRTGFDRIESVTAEGPTAVIRFGTAFPQWRQLFDPVLPEHRLRSELWSGLPDLAAGPFRFVGREPGLSVTLERNPRWWGRPAHLDKVTFLLVPDPVTQRQLLRQGKVDVVAPPTDTRAGPLLETLAPVTSAATGRQALALLNVRRYGDPAQREAILANLPGPDLAEAVLKEEATPVARPALRPAALTGTALVISFPEESGQLGLVARSAQRRLQIAGARVELRAREAKRFWDEWLTTADFDLLLVEADPTELPWCFVTVTDRCDIAGWSDPAALDRDGLASAVTGRAALALWDEVERVAARLGLAGVRLGRGSAALTAFMGEWGWVGG